MGATWRTFAVRRGTEGEVSIAVASWLAAKGFEPVQGERLFAFDEENERGIVFCATSDWITIAFSHSHPEGDRLVFELKKLRKPLLELWVYDSDIWGYRLHHERTLVASFNSNPRYFGGPEELELPRNGDPELLCELCQLTIESKELIGLQRRRAVFSENTAHRFATAIEAEPAAFDYDDLADLLTPLGRRITAGEFAFTHLIFERPDDRQRRRAPRLHEIVLRTAPMPKVDPQMAEWQAQMQRQLLPLTLLFRVLMWCFSIGMWLLSPFFAIWFRWRAKQQMDTPGWLQQLMALKHDPDVIRQDNRIVNRLHGCSIELTGSTTFLESMTLNSVFSVSVDGVIVHCHALRATKLEHRLRFWPGAEILEDRKHFIGDLPARTVVVQDKSPHAARILILTLIETPRAVYCFQATAKEISDATRQHLAELIQHFKIDARDSVGDEETEGA